MPYPTPPAPRIAYDDPTIGEVWISRKEVAKLNGDEELWLPAMNNAASYMNVGEGHAWLNVEGNIPPIGAVWSNTGFNDFQVVFQTPMTILGIEFAVVDIYNGYGVTTPLPSYAIPKISTIHGDSDPFGVDNVARGDVSIAPAVLLYLPGPTGTVNLKGRNLYTGDPWITNTSGNNNPRIRMDSPVAIQLVDLRDVVALRFAVYGFQRPFGATNSMLMKLALYGYPEDPDSLGIISPTLSTPVSASEMTWGDVALGSSRQSRFRVKNYSSALVANDIVIRAENAFGYNTPEPYTMMLFSQDEVVWTSTLTISSLSPGAISSMVHVRLITPTNSLLGNQWPRIAARVGEWT